ncbi:unnamed protein product [Parascedosporium putredinis]|uniref:Uncharacterized protein n=1 Tax=Parascedosporium putredinis TaxID=1442378 RepID=A0A9P1H2P8_9PEZI|nr:unnamed protein product [Parascedosporium putredinis]CAI7993777.1 unnamed protein product [Parascedosporium putredinis]
MSTSRSQHKCTTPTARKRRDRRLAKACNPDRYNPLPDRDRDRDRDCDRDRNYTPADGVPESNGNAANNDGLDTGDIVGVVVGILGFIATATGVWFGYKAIKVKRAAHATPAATTAPQSVHSPAFRASAGT